MRKPLVMTLLMLSSTFSFAQKAHEFGLQFYNFDSYGIIFKTGKKEALTRFSFLSVSSSHNKSTDAPGNTSSTKATGFSRSIGSEYRKQLSGKFRIVFGPEIGYTFQKSKIDNGLSSENRTNIWSIDAIVGINYTFSDNFLISAELSP